MRLKERLTVKFHHFLARGRALIVFIVDVLGGVVAAFRTLLGLDLLADKVTEPSKSHDG